MTTRAEIVGALFAKLAGVSGLVTKSRRWKHWTDVSAAEMPALFLAVPGITIEQRNGLPPRDDIEATIFLYVRVNDVDAIPFNTLSGWLENIESALAPDDPDTECLTLGGRVAHCWIDGEVRFDEGLIDGGRLLVATIPVRMFVNMRPASLGSYGASSSDCCLPNGGTTGQALTKASGANLDVEWTGPYLLYAATTAFSRGLLLLGNAADWLTGLGAGLLGGNLFTAETSAEGRTLLGLGNSATRNVGAAAGTVAEGDHAHSGVYQPVGDYLTDLPVIGAGGSKPFVTWDMKGRVTTGRDLLAGDIPDLSATYKTTRTGVPRELYIPAAALTPQRVAGPSVTTIRLSSTGHMVDVIAFDDAADQYVCMDWSIPDQWGRGTLRVAFLWTGDATGDVVWKVEAVAVQDGGVTDTAYGTAQTITGTLADITKLEWTGPAAALTVGGTTTGNNLVQFRFTRVGTDAADTLAGIAQLRGIKIQYLEATTEATPWP